LVKKLILYLLIFLNLSIILLSNSFVVLTNSFSNSLINFNETLLTMELCLWNLENYQGKAQLVYENGEIKFSCDIEKPSIIDPTKWVWAYPEVYYGYKPWAQNGLSQDFLLLPGKIKKLPNFSLEIEYNLRAPRWLSLNIALDMWVTKEKYPTLVKNGDVELMIWLYNNRLKPAGKKVDEFSSQMSVNKKLIRADWEIWYEKMEWDYVAFRLKKPIVGGRIILPITELIEKARKFLLKKYGHNIDEMYLEDIEFGSEFGNPFIPKASFNWTLKVFKIKVVE